MLQTPDEVAARLRCSKDHVYRLYQSGRLVGVKLGTRSLRFESAAVEAFAAGGSGTGRPSRAEAQAGSVERRLPELIANLRTLVDELLARFDELLAP